MSRRLRRAARRASGAALGGLLGTACLGAPPPEAPRACLDRPVLLVHGHGVGPEVWRPLIEGLVSDGYPADRLAAPAIVPSVMANVAAAERVLAPAGEELWRRTVAAAARAGCPRPPDGLALVAHSMGAVSARYYATRLVAERVRVLVTLAGTNHGSDALCGLPDPGARELCPAFAASEVQALLNGAPGAPADETPYGPGRDAPGRPRIAPTPRRRIAYFTLRLDPDALVRPSASALLDGAGGARVVVSSTIPIEETSPGNFLWRGAGADHDSLLVQPGVAGLVGTLIGGDREPSASGVAGDRQ